MVSYVVVGASRGIGLEFVRQLAARPGAIVFALVRNAKTSIHLVAAVAGLQNVHTLEADVVDHASLVRAAQNVAAVTGGTLDYLIHNAARVELGGTLVYGFEDFANMDELDEEFITSYKANTLGVIHGITAFLPLLRAASTKRIVVISAGGADHKLVRRMNLAHMVAYGTTKAAALLATTKWAAHLRDEAFVVVSLSPGIVDTSGTVGESGDPAGRKLLEQVKVDAQAVGLDLELLTPAESVAAQLKVIDELKPSDNGAFLSHAGGDWIA